MGWGYGIGDDVLPVMSEEGYRIREEMDHGWMDGWMVVVMVIAETEDWRMRRGGREGELLQ